MALLAPNDTWAVAEFSHADVDLLNRPAGKHSGSSVTWFAHLEGR